MSINTPGSNEVPPSQPSSGRGDDERPGFRPPGHKEHMAALRANEAAAQSDDPSAALDADLAALEVGAETLEQRQDRLGKFIGDHFSEICPKQFTDNAISRCQHFEDQYRELFEEPNLALTDEDAADPELIAEITNVVEIASNDDSIAARTEVAGEREAEIAVNDAELIPASEVELAAVQAENANLTSTDAIEIVGLDNDEVKNDEVDRDLTTIKDLQANFESLKAANNGSTIAALKTLLHPETGVISLEMRAIVQRAVDTVEALVTAIPGKEAATEQLLDQVGLNLGGASQTEVFANLFTAAEASDEFTTEDVEKMRWVVAGSDEAIRTGTDVLNTATATTIDPKTGEEVPLHTAENKAEIYPGVYTYTENGENAVLELNIDGHFHKLDVTGMDGMTVGLLAEMMSWQAATEAFGATSFVESVYKLDFNFTGAGAYDVFSLIQMRNRLTTMVGNFEGHDGDIFDPRTRQGLIQDQMRAASPTGTALGWENDHAGSVEHSRKLGLHNDVVLEEFSRYVQNSRATGGAIDPTDLHSHLYGKFPDLVEATDTKDGDINLAA